MNRIDYSTERRKYMIMLFFLLLILAWSAVKPYRYISWFSMAIPTVFYVVVLMNLYKKIEFTMFAYYMVFLQVIIFLIGAKYTYEFNPLFSRLQEIFHLDRNHFDRVAHFSQGFVPFFLIKEYLLQKGYMKRSTLFSFIVIGLVLALSAVYELLEFAAALITKQPIISPQGDPWDTHWDMIMALLGAVAAHLLIGKFHDNEMRKQRNRTSNVSQKHF